MNAHDYDEADALFYAAERRRDELAPEIKAELEDRADDESRSNSALFHEYMNSNFYAPDLCEIIAALCAGNLTEAHDLAARVRRDYRGWRAENAEADERDEIARFLDADDFAREELQNETRNEANRSMT